MVAWCTSAACAGDVPLRHEIPAFRQPSALVWLRPGRAIGVANRRSATMTLIDVEALSVHAEIVLPARPADVISHGNDGHVLIADDREHRVVWGRASEAGFDPLDLLEVAPFPVTLALHEVATPGVAAGARIITVASLWSRTLTVVELVESQSASTNASSSAGVARLRRLAALDMPFPPRAQLALADGRVLVADAFGGRWLSVDLDTRQVTARGEIPAHNIRGLATYANGDRLLVAQQLLNAGGITTSNDVHWGMVVMNLLRDLSSSALVQPERHWSQGSSYSQLGPGNAAGDPSEVLVDDTGRVVVSLSGVGEVAVAQNVADAKFRRVPVGRRPVALLLDADRDRVFVANTLSDSVSMVSLRSTDATSTVEISLGAQPPLAAVDRGERLFYDAHLSRDAWFSCHSCHTDGHTNSGLSDNLGDGSFGAPKLVPSLFGVASSAPWAWDGHFSSLEDQIASSGKTTMRGRSLRSGEVEDLAAYLRTLEPPSSVMMVDSESAARGARLFEAQECGRCHVPPAFTSEKTYDVGRPDANGRRRFNPPSLRGVGLRQAFFHDGAAKSLEAVFVEHRHQLQRALTDAELRDLTAYLRSL